eukprot:8809517-Alexandrium_andersonii.AAC.1
MLFREDLGTRVQGQGNFNGVCSSPRGAVVFRSTSATSLFIGAWTHHRRLSMRRQARVFRCSLGTRWACRPRRRTLFSRGHGRGR